MSTNSYPGRPTNMMSFGRAMKANQSATSVASSVYSQYQAAPGEPIPPVPRMPSVFAQASGTPPSTRPKTSHRDGPARQPKYMPAPSIRSTQASIAGTEPPTSNNSNNDRIQSAVFQCRRGPPQMVIGEPWEMDDMDAKPDPIDPDDDDVRVWPAPKNRPFPTSWYPPPAPTRRHFPGDPLSWRHFEEGEPQVVLREESYVKLCFDEYGRAKKGPERPTWRRHDALLNDAPSAPAKPDVRQREPPPVKKVAPLPAKDPYHRELYDAYPHVFRPKQQPQPRTIPPPPKSRPRTEQRPKHSRNDSSATFASAGKLVKNWVSVVKGFTAHRGTKKGKSPRLGMNMALTGSFHDFHPKIAGQAGVLHSEIKAIPIGEAQKKFAGQSRSIPSDPAPARKPRKVKVVGDPDRGTRFGDFLASDLFDDSSEEDDDEPSLPQPARPKKLRNRGASKPLPELPAEAPPARPSRPLRPAVPEAWERQGTPHPRPDKRVLRTKHSWFPDRDGQKGEEYESLRANANFTEVVDSSDEEDMPHSATDPSAPTRRVPRDTVLDIDPTSPLDWDEIHQGEFPSGRRKLDFPEPQPEVSRFDPLRATTYTAIGPYDNFGPGDFDADLLFGNVDEEIETNDDVPDSEKHWVKDETRRLYELAQRARGDPEDDIIIDTFPRDGHVSWRGTEVTDYAVHVGRRRFSQHVYDKSGEQDSAGRLMEKLGRQMNGLDG